MGFTKSPFAFFGSTGFLSKSKGSTGLGLQFGVSYLTHLGRWWLALKQKVVARFEPGHRSFRDESLVFQKLFKLFF